MFAMRMPKTTWFSHLFPLCRALDLGIESGEVLVDLVFAVVLGSLWWELVIVSSSVALDGRCPPRTFASMHVRSACSRAAHPCAVWPDDAQQPVRNQRLVLRDRSIKMALRNSYPHAIV